MPWHGLAQDGQLTIVGGTKTIQGANGCTVVRHPAAPGAGGRTVEQQARDVAEGYEWRDYALLCGTGQHINGGPGLAFNAWLYCAPDGRTWVMTAEVTAAGDVATIEIWRRDLFGVFGRQYTITDELIATLPLTIQLPNSYTGPRTPAEVAAECGIFTSSMLQVSPAGDVVHVHMVVNYLQFPDDENPYLATRAFFESFDCAVYAITTVTVSGNGDADNGGVGISAVFTNSETYNDLKISDAGDRRYENGTDIPGWDSSTQTVAIGPPDSEQIPCFDGNTHEERYECEEDFPGFLWDRVTGNSTDGNGKVLRTHHGDLITYEGESFLQQTKNWIVNGIMEGTRQWTAVGNPPDCVWNPGPFVTTNNAEARDIAVRPFGDGHFSFNFNGGQVSGGESWSFEDTYTEGGRSLTGCAEQFPYDGTGPIVYPPQINFTGGPLTGGMTIPTLSASLSGIVNIYPGVIVAQWQYLKPDNSGLWVYKAIYIAIGESSAQQVDSYNFEDASATPPASQVITGWGWQPVTQTWISSKGMPAVAYMYC